MRIFILSLLLSAIFNLSAQRLSNKTFTLGVKAGIAFTEAVGVKVNGFQKKSLTGGLSFRMRLGKKWTGQFETIYIEKGSKNRGKPENGYIYNYSLRLFYLEAPVLFQYHKKRWMYEFGPGFGYIVHAREYYYDGRSGNGNLAGDNPVTQSEVSFNLGISYQVNDKWSVNCRYTNSVIPVRKVDYAKPAWYKTGMLNCVLALTLSRNFEINKQKKKTKVPEGE